MPCAFPTAGALLLALRPAHAAASSPIERAEALLGVGSVEEVAHPRLRRLAHVAPQRGTPDA